ncbi:hypothetical protein RI129_009669 [Pyrocoelia pectoralis]|uniref:Major facilitator superfamily (MFS) profile domain-containing protein n=1 Tax=Pyrocoelia pectoralis TaxID=417401 RepID=A0AAN7ZG08_9COLE
MAVEEMISHDHSNSKRNVRFIQYISAICAGVLQISQFVNLSWGSPTLPRLLAEDSPIGKPLTYDEISWVLSVIYLGTMVGNTLLMVLLDKVGPKSIMLLGAVLTIISWIFLGLAKSLSVLIIGRVIAGVSDGMSLPCISIYVCEIACKDIRGRLASIPMFIGVFGNLFIFGAGPYLEYTTLIISCAVFPTIFLVSFSFMPNSPYFLIRKGKRRDAERSLMRLLGTKSKSQVEDRLREVEETVERDTGNLTLMQSLLMANFRKSLLIVFVAYNIINFCGLTFLSSYLQVFLATGSISLSKELASVFWGLVQFPAVMLSGLLIDKLGRRPLFCVSSLGAGIALILEGGYIYLQGIVNLESVSFLPVLCLSLYGFFISLGVLPLPYILVGELFATGTKKVGSFVVSCYSSIIIFAHIKVFGSMFDSWGLYSICWLFGGVCFSGILFSLLMLPETKGKSFNEIQSNLSSTTKNTSHSHKGDFEMENVS